MKGVKNLAIPGWLCLPIPLDVSRGLTTGRRVAWSAEWRDYEVSTKLQFSLSDWEDQDFRALFVRMSGTTWQLEEFTGYLCAVHK